jgi:mRNA interferase MazF
MALTFHPGAGAIVICDFSTGFKAPEMVKVRPVVVISPRRRRGQLATVIPLSSTEPTPAEPWHFAIPPGVYPPARGPMWAKADMVVTVALDRLDRVLMRNASGQRTYHVFQLSEADMAGLRRAVLAALGFA